MIAPWRPALAHLATAAPRTPPPARDVARLRRRLRAGRGGRALAGTLALAGSRLDRAARAQHGRGAVEPAADPQHDAALLPRLARGAAARDRPSRTSTASLAALVLAFCACYARRAALRAALSARGGCGRRSSLATPRRRARAAAVLRRRLRLHRLRAARRPARPQPLRLHGAGAAPARRDPPARSAGPTLTTPYGPAFHAPQRGARAARDRRRRCGRSRPSPRSRASRRSSLIWRVAPRLGRSPRSAIAFYGLNPLVLVFAVAGAHNEALFGLLARRRRALRLTRRASARGGVALGRRRARSRRRRRWLLPFALIGARRRGRTAARDRGGARARGRGRR